VHNKRNIFLLLGSLAAVLVLGCQSDEIRSYRVPKAEATRLLAAIIPHGDQTWFFKLVGPASQIDAHKEAFDQFLHSVHFADNAERPVAWTAPQDWQPGPEAKMRYATFYLGPREHPLELTVFHFPGAAGSVLNNVNRWRGQIGLREIQETELSQYSKNLQLACGPATLVDMTNRGSRGAPAAMPGPDILSRRAESRSRLQYATPEGWKEKPDPKGIRVVVFEIADGAVEAGVTSLGGPGGGVLGNVNRWRGQLHLQPVDDQQLQKEVRPIEVAGTPGHYVDLTGPAAAEKPPVRILGVILPRGEQTWFFTIKGPADLVEKQKAAFEAFVKSVRFETQ
jgi:hypothetical protein